LCGNELFELRPVMNQRVTIGSRGSKLALWQAEWIKKRLETLHPGLNVTIKIIKTKGDKILDVPLAKVGGKGLFVKEIEDALLNGDVDLAVHSMKDMPGQVPEGLRIGAVPEREVPWDVLISRHDTPFADLKNGARVGTSSLRRASQLRHARPDIEIIPLRGNLDTRLRKLTSEDLDAIVLAAAGVKRLRLEHRITQYLDAATMLPAAGQGALCVEIRDDDAAIATLIGPLDHEATRIVITGERALLHHLGGSCQIPIAAFGQIERGRFRLRGLVADLDGTRIVSDTHAGAAERSEQIGIELAEHLIDRGAAEILNQIKQSSPE
jgi:hydroxymethylbilane synthase